jgi:pimeloyl-ACP methyl ester carboxylesterase
LNVVTAGAGQPLVAIHGLNGDRTLMHWLLEPLFDERVGTARHYVDLPGHGAHRAPGKAHSDAILDRLVKTIDGVTRGAPFCLVGSSIGAYLAFGVAVRGIAVTVPVIKPLDADRQLSPMLKAATDDALFDGLPEDLVGILRDLMANETTEAMDAFRSVFMPAFVRSDQEFIQRWRSSPEYALSTAPTFRFEGPGLVITGRQDTSVGYEQALDLRDQLPRTTFVALDGTGHTADIERTAVVRALLSDWLDRVDAFS